MKKREKSLISILLLVVGVIFILIAGGIFVTTAWEYIPLFAKQLALLVVSGVMFGGSYGLSKNEKLGWISDALFHLGNVFIGFFVIAVMGGVVENGLDGNAFKILAACGIMAISVGVKMLVNKNCFDYVVLSLLLDLLLISGCVAFDGTFSVYMFLLTGYVILQAVLDVLQHKMPNHGRFGLCVAIIYLIHACIYGILAGVSSLLLLCDDAEAGLIFKVIAWLGVFTTLTTIAWNVRRNEVLRIGNSLVAIWFVFIVANGICQILGGTDSSMVMVLTTLFIVMLMTWLRRGEITGLTIAAAVVIPYGQLLCYFFDAWSWWDGTDSLWNTMYNPYSVIIGVGLVALYILKYGLKDMSINWKESRLLTFASAQMVNGIILWICSKMVSFWGMAFFLLVAIDWLLVAMLFKNKIVRKVFVTFAMVAFVLAVMNQPFIEIKDNYIVEWYCFLFGIMIVLFRYIWYDKKDKLSYVYFVATCIILSTLLLHNVVSGELGNVMILGMTGIVMLVVSAMRNDKKYVVVSSGTLILLVLYLTREFWLSIAWWVYLFAAGVALVLLAVKKAKEA